jgi:ABC-type Fe3+/spermidine/putrescine transport system ATPase subunit
MAQPDYRSDNGLTGIELDKISKRFGAMEVLRDLSLEIKPGELCCLLGPSGCGKTTALKIINGLLEADAGRVRLYGQDITDVPPQQRNLGMVFQNYALFPQMNVFDNVAYGLRRRRVVPDIIRRKVGQALEMVRLEGVEKRRAHELSGGQQQRVALARALIIEPRALLLDEPLSNLDARLRADMRDEIKRLQRELEITMVYVTHDQEESMSIADRIVVMHNGRIEQIGTPREIYEHPATAFAAGFVGNINLIPGEVITGELRLLGQSYSRREGGPPDGPVVCAVRPERIGLDNGGDAPIRGRIQEISYFGAVTRYRVTVEDGDAPRELIVQVPTANTPAAVGDEVGLTIAYKDIRFFPAANSSAEKV